ncbi:hypothetical protein [Enterobacter kobei]|uniref:Uncharacterized protein n=1 Tax=Enterobacter kobei TaxID=208224 RepID=A0AA86M3K9_9ENTR|nr:hypothetical protein [Enterobacter kobei]BCU54511.1 hypothetical protein ENKO_11050 [Enterobacter kobei]SIR49773.1 hypothetical protein SAMN05444841_10537 [Enterobacter kobei]
MDFPKNINFNHIFIIDLLKDNEFQTARRLDDDLSVFIPSSQRVYLKIASKEQLIKTLLHIELMEIPQGIKPIIHIEGHGSEQSLSLPNGTTIRWGELYEVLSKINFALNNTLILFIATCYGFHYINTLNILTPTPTYCLISPSKSIEFGGIESGVAVFYKNLFITKDLDISINNLMEHDNTFDFYYSDRFFIGLMINYFKEGHYGKSSRQRLERLLSEAFNRDESEGCILARNERRAVLSQRRKYAKKFIKSENSRFDIYKRNSLKFLGNYDKEIYDEIMKEVKLKIK